MRYVIIGAFAARAQQAPIPARRDIDLTRRQARRTGSAVVGAQEVVADLADVIRLQRVS
jgi:hypothetical protein